MQYLLVLEDSWVKQNLYLDFNSFSFVFFVTQVISLFCFERYQIMEQVKNYCTLKDRRIYIDLGCCHWEMEGNSVSSTHIIYLFFLSRQEKLYGKSTLPNMETKFSLLLLLTLSSIPYRVCKSTQFSNLLSAAYIFNLGILPLCY